MNPVQMTIAVVFGGVRHHLFRTTFKAHADVAPRALNLIAASPPDYRHSASCIDTESHSVLFYVLFEHQIVFYFITGFSRMVGLLNNFKITLQRRQNSAQHSQHLKYSLVMRRVCKVFLSLICAQPAVKQKERSSCSNTYLLEAKTISRFQSSPSIKKSRSAATISFRHSK